MNSFYSFSWCFTYVFGAVISQVCSFILNMLQLLRILYSWFILGMTDEEYYQVVENNFTVSQMLVHIVIMFKLVH